MRRRFRLAFTATVLSLALLAGCLRHGGPSGPSREPRWLRWSIATPLSQPRLAFLTGAGLVELRADGSIEPLLAQSWEWTPANELVFHLRTEARWSDGSPLLAADFLNTWRAASVHFTFRALDAKTLLITPDERRALFLDSFAHPSLWPKRTDATIGPFLNARGKGTLRFARNPGFPFPIRYEGLEISVEESMENRLARFREREIDLVDDLDSAVSARLTPAASLQIVRGPYRWLLAFNANHFPSNDRARREIFAASIAREETAPLAGWHDYVAAGFGWLDPTASTRRGPAFNPSQAKTLYDAQDTVTRAARWTLSWDARPDARELAENLQAQWQKNLGVTVELTPGESGALQLVALENDVRQPWNTLTRFAFGRAPGGWRSPRLDEAATLAPRAATRGDLDQQLDRGERVLSEEALLAIPLLTKGCAVLRQARIHDLQPDAFGNWEFRRANLD